MKLLVTSDWHLDAVTLGHPRRPELLAYLQRVKRDIVEQAVDLVVVAGDMCDPGSMLASLYAADIIREYRELAAATRLNKLVAIAGNHDVIETDRPLTTLSPAVACFEDHGVRVAETPSVISIAGVAFLLLPYVARAWWDSEARGHCDPGPAAMLDDAFERAAEMKKSGCPLVGVSHLTVEGARIGSETAEMSRGRDVDLPVERIAALKPDLWFNGHYHAPQIVAFPGLTVHIPGSPLSYSTDDPSAGKGYLIAEV